MPTANSMQIGGNHYKTAREHWDLCIAIGMGPQYLACTATKYIARWRKKNGLQDLQKALHYVNKLLENQDKIKFTGKRSHDIQVEVEQFVQANKLTEIEELAVDCLAQLVDERDLYCAQSYILLLMDEAEAQLVPLEDSNKHAERVECLVSKGAAVDFGGNTITDCRYPNCDCDRNASAAE